MGGGQSQTTFNVYHDGYRLLPGELLTTARMEEQPRFEWFGNPKKLYTLVMVDLSDPSASYLYLLDINIPGNDLAAATHVYHYFPPRLQIQPGSAPHHFQVLLAEQPSKIDPLGMRDAAPGREHFDVEKFATTYGLIPVNAIDFEVSSQPTLPPPEVVNAVAGPTDHFTRNGRLPPKA